VRGMLPSSHACLSKWRASSLCMQKVQPLQAVLWDTTCFAALRQLHSTR
jgi:hypothetical protein